MRPRASSRMLKESGSFVLAALSTFGKREASSVKRISFPDSDVSRFTFHERRAVVLLVACVFAGFVACDRTPDQAPESKNAVVADRSGVLHLTSEELARTVIEVTPVARGQ